jgi:hypothetical protein
MGGIAASAPTQVAAITTCLTRILHLDQQRTASWMEREYPRAAGEAIDYSGAIG